MIVTDIGYGHWLDAGAAASFFRVCAAIGRRLDVNEAGRTYEQQAKFRWEYENVPGAPFALPAGTSIHEFGRAIDTDDRFIELMRDHGWIRTALARNEPWHFEYFIEHDNHRYEGIPSNGTATSFPTPTEVVVKKERDEYMRYFYTQDSGGSLWTLANTATGEVVQERDQEIANSWAVAWDSAIVCDVQSFLNAMHAIELTTRGNKDRDSKILEILEDIQAQIDNDEVRPEAPVVEPAPVDPPKAPSRLQ